MISSIPKSAQELGFSFQDYEKLAKNLTRILNMPQEKWQNILDEANKTFPERIKRLGIKLICDICYDREFFRESGYLYHEGSPIQGCLTTNLADYLLRNQDKIKI